MYTLWANICVWIFKSLLECVFFSRTYIQFLTSAWRVVFNLRFDYCFVFGPSWVPFFWNVSLPCRMFLWDVFSFSKLVPSVFCPAVFRRIILFSPLTFFGRQITGFLLYSWRWFLFSVWQLHLFRTLVPGVPKRLCLVLHRSSFVIRLTYVRSFCALVPPLTSGIICFEPVSFFFRLTYFVPRTWSRPSPLAMFCFAPQFPLSSDWLPFVPRTSSRPSPGTLFCFEPEFLLSSTDFLLFRALVPGLLPPALFCSAPRFPMHSHPHSFVSCAISFHFAAHILLSWSLTALCCRPSPNNRMRMKPHVCLLSC